MHFLSDPLLREILRLLRWTSSAAGTGPDPGPLPLCNQVLLARTETGLRKENIRKQWEQIFVRITSRTTQEKKALLPQRRLYMAYAFLPVPHLV